MTYSFEKGVFTLKKDNLTYTIDLNGQKLRKGNLELKRTDTLRKIVTKSVIEQIGREMNNRYCGQTFGELAENENFQKDMLDYRILNRLHSQNEKTQQALQFFALYEKMLKVGFPFFSDFQSAPKKIDKNLIDFIKKEYQHLMERNFTTSRLDAYELDFGSLASQYRHSMIREKYPNELYTNNRWYWRNYEELDEEDIAKRTHLMMTTLKRQYSQPMLNHLDRMTLNWAVSLIDAEEKGLSVDYTSRNILNEVDKSLIYLTAIEDKETNEKLAKHRVLELSQEDDTYIYKQLLTAEDFRDEAGQQRNCVLSYLRHACDGVAAIVSMREKTNPKKSFITLEIRYGKVVQAKLFANGEVRDKEVLKHITEYEQKIG